MGTEGAINESQLQKKEVSALQNLHSSACELYKRDCLQNGINNDEYTRSQMKIQTPFEKLITFMKSIILVLKLTTICQACM